MASMFDENFSFSTPWSPSLDSTAECTREPSRSVSPCSPTASLPAPSYTVNDLAALFATQRIRRDAQMCYDSCAAYANPDDDAGWQLDSPLDDAEDEDLAPAVSRARTFPLRPHSPSRRLQRQVNTRLLCSLAHSEDIATLVARMVNCDEQCAAAEGTVPVAEGVDEDEGYNSSSENSAPPSRQSSIGYGATQRIDYRRPSMKSTGASVQKSVRLRKARRTRSHRASEANA